VAQLDTPAHSEMRSSSAGDRHTVEPLLTTSEVATWLGVAPISLRKWRTSGAGPQFIRVCGAVRYRRSDVENWIAGRSAASTSETAG
jgi:predicted DNA-binding transcriptional regulator AlpA